MDDIKVADKEQPVAPSKKKRSFLRRATGWFFKSLGLLLFLLLIVILCVCGGSYWLLQTESGQQWLVAKANNMLDGGSPNGKMRFHISHLSGSLPFEINVGLEALDDKGVFLTAPQNKFVWNWRKLPKSVDIETLNITDAALSRLPDLPPAPEEPKKEEKPLSFDDLRAYIGQAADFLANPPSWMPTVRIGNIALVNASFPESLLGATDNGKDKDHGKKDEADENNAPKISDDILRADADADLSLDKSGAKINASARLAAEAGKKAHVPCLDFESANVDLKIAAKPEKEALGAHVGLEADLDNPTLAVADLPANLLGEKSTLKLGLDAMANCPDYGPADGVKIKLAGPGLDAGRIRVNGDGHWQSGAGFTRASLDGPLACKLKIALANGAPDAKDLLAMLRAPVNILLDINGEIEKPDLALDVACADIEASGHAVKNLDLRLTGRELVLPLGLAPLEADETKLDLALKGSLDNHRLALNTGLFYKPMPSGSGDFTAGLRKLELMAAGVKGNGDLAATMLAGKKPAIDGAIKLAVADWQALSALLPGKSLSGNARVDLALAHGNNGQGANVLLEIPEFSLAEGKEKIVALKNFNGKVDLADVFANPGIDATLKLGNADVAGMHFGARVAAKGLIAGPLEAEVESTGSVASKVAARWEPGKAEVRTLDVSMDMPPLGGGKGKPVTLGLRSAGPMQITYGDGGIGIGNVDLRIVPSGRLTARGGLSANKLDLAINLADLAFKPWQALVGQLPEGSAEFRANLSGTPQRPTGNFRFGVANVKVPNVQLPPLTMALVGAIEPAGGNGGNLVARLEIPRETVTKLGGTNAQVNARIPLLFGQDGVPKPNMKGPLAAKVLWDGALGPLWNLVPVADMRLNGRVGVNVEAGGSIDAPRINGRVNIANGRYENVALGVLITEINAKLALDDAGKSSANGMPGSMRLDMSATDGRGGKVTVNGGGALTGDNLDIEAKINRLRPLRRRDVHVELSGAARVTGSATAPVVVGEIVVDKGEVLLDNIDMGAGSVTTLPITTPATLKAEAEAEAKKKAGTSGTGSLNVRINMPPRFSVEGRGLTSLWQANLLISGTPRDPAITGEVNCYRGNFDFLGKNFILSRGTVTFAGGSLANPLLDIELTNETPDLTAHLWITGPVNKMKLSLTSDPSLPRDDILSRVLFGRSVNELSRLEALQLAGAVAQLAGFTGNGSSIFQIGKKALGLDVLRLGSSSTEKGGEPGETTASGTTLEAGKYINDWIYMGVQQGMKPDSTAFVIELELTPRSNIEIRTDQSNTWGGYKWKYNY